MASTIIAGLAVFAPTMVMAQTQPAQTQQQEDEEAAEIDEVVVTGSRIRRNEFTSSQPIQVITSEQATLEGLADTSEILQSSTAANTATQINNFFTGFVTTGGPGVNTVSLRGLGAQRTLVLINGRRVGPAGVRGTVGPTDLNTIPSSLIERAEILTDGASSIYGSDAVAGVINIITKTNLDGGFIGAYASMPLEGGGEEVQVSASYGNTFDRGYLSVGADYYERSELLFGDREHFDCPQDRVYSDPQLMHRIDVLEDGEYKCDFVLNSIMRTQLAGSIGPVLAANRRDGDFVFNSAAVQGGGFTGCDAPGFQHVAGGFNSGATPGPDCSITASPTAVRRAAYSVYPLYNDRYASRTAISPVTRTSFTAFGGYDLTPNIELFGELLLNRRESEQFSWRQLFPTVSPYHTNNPFGGPFNGMTNTFNGGYYVTPVALVDTFSRQQVDYGRAVVGLRGDIDLFGRGWDWELAAQYSKSDGTYGGNFFYNDRVAATAGLDALFAGRPFGASAVPGTPEAANCDVARLTSATACPTGGVNWFTDAFISNGQLTAEEAAFINGYEEGSTTYVHQYVEGVISGDLFDLPAGPVGAALGFHMRKEEIDDQPGEQQQAGNLWGQTAAGRTRGSDTVKELFAEVELPLLRDVPMFESLSVNLSGRLSDYDSYGENSTYKVGLNWRITPEFRIRASQGTSFRAPALYELFLANQTSFLGQANVDPCRNWGTSTNQRLRDNCAADGVPDNYNDPGSSALITTGGGVGILEPETAEAVSVGLIWTPTFADLNIALDYFQIDVDNQVAQFGAGNIVSACYNSDDYPTDPLCTLFVRDKTGGPRNNQILSVNDSYVNISRQSNKGLDLNVRYTREFSFMDLTIAARVSHILDWTQQVFTASAPTILNSRIGSPETVGELSFRFDRGDWTVFYGIDYVGPADNQPFNTTPGQEGGATVFLGQAAYVERGVDEYLNHAVSIRKRFDKWTFQAGIQNIFDENPPYLGIGSGATVIGNTPLASQYDWNGRTAFVNVSRTF
ncbi:TonB-dependent siderophore receptor [Brevundimonas sp.]|uniref:TonB-dependent receptor plug domain-containing protein n=2 Tax=Brevundimonas sp. TaxID=1871086 RepID=UPI00273792B4|nr:TonB-dependent receptor [Brevundimonas sp.]MDP3802362.1 TonB-dependent receptor [Brevundimonas sp.]